MFYGIRIGSLGLPGYGGGGAEPEADVIRVRRTSDSTEADYTLTEWDDGTLDTFVGVGDGCLAEWKDSSGNGNDVIQSTTTLQPKVAVSGVVQEGVVFDGTNDYLTKGSRLTSGSPTALTVAAFVYISSTLTTRAIAAEWGELGNQRAWLFAVNNNRLVAYVCGDGAFATQSKLYQSPAASIPSGVWKHVAFTYSVNTLLLYIDGILATPTKSTDGTMTQIFSTTHALDVGAVRDNSSTFFPWSGGISHLHIEQAALTAPQIATLAAGGEVGSPLLWLKGNYSP